MNEPDSRRGKRQTSTHSVTRAIRVLKGNDREAAGRAAELLFSRYYPMVVRFARSRLKKNARRVADEEDAAMETLCAFFEGIPGFDRLENREDLKHLLLAIAKCRAYDQIRFYGRDKRKVLGESVFLKPGHPSELRGLDQVASGASGPDMIAMTAEEYRRRVQAHERLLASLAPELRRVYELKLQAYTHEQVAEELGCSLRTVEREWPIIRKLLDVELARAGDRAGEGLGGAQS